MALACVAMVLLGGSLLAQDRTVYKVHDTLSLGREPDERAAGILQAIAWTPSEFQAVVTANNADWTDADRLVTFDSPRPDATANGTVNTVILEWYVAKDEQGQPIEGQAPAVLLLHSLDVRLGISRGLARTLARHGIHGLLMHGPGYGQREYDPFRGYGDRFFERAVQAITDARRARDAIAALPGVQDDRISIQGLSLGGFFATGAAAIDNAFEYTIVHFSGADLHTLLTQGLREAQWVRLSMARHGIDDETLKRKCDEMELARIAHRLNPQRTWLYSAKADQVIPRACSMALAQAAGLDEAHHIWLSGDHYLALAHLPWCAERMVEIVKGKK